MEEIISLKSKEKLDYLAIIIEICLLEKRGLINAVSTESTDEYFYIKVPKSCFADAAEAVAEWLVRSSVFYFAFDIIEDEAENLPPDVKYRLIDKANEKVYGKEVKAITGEISASLESFSQKNDEISFDGFIMFSASGYIPRLYLILYELLAEAEAELEYSRTVALLKEYVGFCDTALTEIIIVYEESEKFNFYNRNGENITDQCKKDFFAEFGNADVSAEDIILGTLIQKLPERINIYCDEAQANIINTIKVLFEDRVSVFEISDFVTKL